MAYALTISSWSTAKSLCRSHNLFGGQVHQHPKLGQLLIHACRRVTRARSPRSSALRRRAGQTRRRRRAARRSRRTASRRRRARETESSRLERNEPERIHTAQSDIRDAESLDVPQRERPQGRVMMTDELVGHE